ncbi:unnamed protein product [Protopolystoma xenopodis]|uniref:Uncharacterized protein n=1 Tax=Protopolystoma xenopodis TaxID=117903 RepID=A0A448WT32_9PLAT|nr:unnamed protein product [Protopolystoma xenopodis]
MNRVVYQVSKTSAICEPDDPLDDHYLSYTGRERKRRTAMQLPFSATSSAPIPTGNANMPGSSPLLATGFKTQSSELSNSPGREDVSTSIVIRRGSFPLRRGDQRVPLSRRGKRIRDELTLVDDCAAWNYGDSPLALSAETTHLQSGLNEPSHLFCNREKRPNDEEFKPLQPLWFTSLSEAVLWAVNQCAYEASANAITSATALATTAVTMPTVMASTSSSTEVPIFGRGKPNGASIALGIGLAVPTSPSSPSSCDFQQQRATAIQHMAEQAGSVFNISRRRQ